MNTTRQMDGYGFVTEVTTELETVEEQRYRLKRQRARRAAREKARQARLRDGSRVTVYLPTPDWWARVAMDFNRAMA